jgi:predicted NBD/HSP70 family sugar kinase
MMQQHQKRTAGRNGTNLAQAHLLNQRVVLEVIRLRGPVSRVDIARETKLTNQTVFNIVDGLRRAGLIQEFGLKAAERGQPARLFDINPDGTFSIGLHLERDHIAAVLLDFKGVIRTRTYRGNYLSTPAEARKQAVSSIKELQRNNGRRRVCGLGVALPGPVDSRNGKVISMPNFPGWEEFNVRDYFSDRTGLRVLVDNDATAAAIGESWSGMGRNLSSFFYIYMGFGVGGGIIVDGRPFRGFRGNSGEIGHVVVNRSKTAKPCGCGKRGCLETHTSLRSLCQHLAERGHGKIELPQLVELFRRRDAALSSWLDTAAHFLSIALQSLQLLFDPEAFVIGGHLPGPLLAFICEQCTSILGGEDPPQGTSTPSLLQGSLGDEAAAIGAATLPTHKLIAPNYEGITNGDHLSLLTSAQR